MIHPSRKIERRKAPEDKYQETQWEIVDNSIIPQDVLFTLAREAEIGGHVFDISLVYTDPKASNFEKSHTQRTDTVIVPRSFFH